MKDVWPAKMNMMGSGVFVGPGGECWVEAVVVADVVVAAGMDLLSLEQEY